MCKLGDIIVVNKYIGDDGNVVGRHSFVVVNDEADFIEGYRYDLVTNVISSFKNEEHKTKKLSFEGNLEVMTNNVINKIPKNNNSGFIKANQLIYFEKSKIDYYVLGRIDDELLDKLILLIIALRHKNKIKHNIENIK